MTNQTTETTVFIRTRRLVIVMVPRPSAASQWPRPSECGELLLLVMSRQLLTTARTTHPASSPVGSDMDSKPSISKNRSLNGMNDPTESPIAYPPATGSSTSNTCILAIERHHRNCFDKLNFISPSRKMTKLNSMFQWIYYYLLIFPRIHCLLPPIWFVS